MKFVKMWYCLYNNIKETRMASFVKKLSIKKKRWQISHSRKILRDISKYNSKCQHKPTPNREKYSKIRVIAPPQLNLNNNLECSIKFFDDVFSAIKKCSPGARIYFDLSQVEDLSIGAIMYIIALIKNVKRLRTYKILCEGNVPEDGKSRALIVQSGFYRYVSSPMSRMPLSYGDQIQISGGTYADGELVGKICDFVHNLSGKDKQCTKRLFPMIIELMTNTHQHAYTKESNIMKENWYIFAENTEKSIKFVFLDTGAGIPATIKKSLGEKIKEIFPFSNNDARFIASALRGEFRSETRQINRGKGLPEIYNDSKAGTISDLLIISGAGKCIVKKNGEIEEQTLQLPFMGTLFSWNFIK